MINIKNCAEPQIQGHLRLLKSEINKCRFGHILTSPVDFDKNSPTPYIFSEAFEMWHRNSQSTYI